MEERKRKDERENGTNQKSVCTKKEHQKMKIKEGEW